MKKNLKTGKSLLSLALSAAMVAGLIPAWPFAPHHARADELPEIASVITNILPSRFEDWDEDEERVVSLPVDSLDWEITDHPGYDGAYTEQISKNYNGIATPNHVVLNGSTARFFGYYAPAHMDKIFTAGYAGGFDSLRFRMQPIVMNFHTFSESGVLFNGSFSGPGDEFYTGY
ncbi:MAG: hypothetical protein FWE47_03875, partial [Oscillospiraceae bacterium]|nr:hypothetical protein [Oscillospiraceae bacterium]